MPRRAAGPRLYLEKAQRDADGKLTHHARWCIKDRGRKYSTGCSEDDSRGAEKALAAYIAEKHVAGAASGVRSPAAIPLADVVALYARHIADRHARPHETSARLDRLLNFFGDKMLGDVNGELCRAYVRERGRQFAARRELEELRAAINYHHSEGLCQAIVAVVLPPKSEPRGRWLSRGEAARLIWSAWRYREIQKGHPTGRRARAARGALPDCRALYRPTQGRVTGGRAKAGGRPALDRSRARRFLWPAERQAQQKTSAADQDSDTVARPHATLAQERASLSDRIQWRADRFDRQSVRGQCRCGRTRRRRRRSHHQAHGHHLVRAWPASTRMRSAGLPASPWRFSRTSMRTIIPISCAASNEAMVHTGTVTGTETPQPNVNKRRRTSRKSPIIQRAAR